MRKETSAWRGSSSVPDSSKGTRDSALGRRYNALVAVKVEHRLRAGRRYRSFFQISQAAPLPNGGKLFCRMSVVLVYRLMSPLQPGVTWRYSERSPEHYNHEESDFGSVPERRHRYHRPALLDDRQGHCSSLLETEVPRIRALQQVVQAPLSRRAASRHSATLPITSTTNHSTNRYGTGKSFRIRINGNKDV